jgi:small conductance mechanosensitive channel
MLFVLRPFRVGEYIETASLKGYVGDRLVLVRNEDGDGLCLMAPNSTLWNSSIVNHSREPDRRQQLSIAVGNDVDVGKVKNIVKPVLSDEMHARKIGRRGLCRRSLRRQDDVEDRILGHDKGLYGNPA